MHFNPILLYSNTPRCSHAPLLDLIFEWQPVFSIGVALLTARHEVSLG
jgi:hypothetical protein